MRRRYLCSGEEKIDLSKPYFAIEVLEDDLQVKFPNNYEYCIDDGVWKKANSITNIQANAGQTLYFRATLTPTRDVGIGSFSILGRCNLSGNIMSLLFGDNFEGQTDLIGYDYAFYNLFYNCANIIDSSQLVLPATTLASNCYRHMFSYCTSLTTALELPATILAESCYYCMFQGCSNLTTAPELPATTLTKWCYSYMFYHCTKLNYIKMLATDISATNCLNNWVYNVSSNGTFIKNKDATWNVTGTSGIPSGWTVETASA